MHRTFFCRTVAVASWSSTASAAKAANSRMRRVSRRFLSTQRSLPTTVDHIIIGGGIAGVSASVALAQSTGNTAKATVLLLEQNMLTSGTTWHAAGLVTQVKGHEAMVEMAKHGVHSFSKNAECSGWKKTGSLGLARVRCCLCPRAVSSQIYPTPPRLA